MSIDHSLLFVQVTTATASRLDNTLLAILPLPDPNTVNDVGGILAEIHSEHVVVDEGAYLLAIGLLDCGPIRNDVLLREKLVR